VTLLKTNQILLMKRTTLNTLTFLFVLALAGLQSLAQPATSDKNKLRDPMVMAPGYVAPDNDQIEATVITIGDYDNFKLGVDFAECSIANNPLNPKQYYAVWNSTGSSGGRGYYTNDGYTWTAGNPTWSGTMWGDVVVSYDSLGNLAYQNMYGSGSTVQGVKVAMSNNNGQTWSAPLNAMSGSDKNWIFSDQTSGPYSNYIYGIMTNSSSSGQSFSKSDDLGQSWQSPTSFTSSAIPGSTVCVGPEGDIQGGAVYAVANTGSSFSSVYKFYKSTDGGQTFTLKSSQQFSNTVGTQVGGRNAVLNMRTRPYPFVAADNSYGPHRGRLYLVYASNNPSGNGNKPDIFCRYSDAGGATFSSAKIVNDDVNSQANHNWFPAIWCEKNTGRLYISWLDTRDTPTSDSCMLYATYTDDGVNFAPNQQISNKKMKINCNSCGGGGTPMYLGDYNGVAANPMGAMLAWTDFRDNTFGSYVSYFPDFGMRAEPSIDTLEPVAVINVNIPSVKLFSDTVVVSATITGNPGTFNITFPQGNKLWSFPGSIPIQVSGNGAVSTGDYILTITATGTNGIPVHKRIATIRALTPIAPTAGFVVSDTTICEGGMVNFTDLSAGPPTSWQWSFPGGTPSSSAQQNPSNIQYSAPGVYDVTLSVTNQVGTSTLSKTGYVVVNPIPVAPVATSVTVCENSPVPDFTAEGENLKWYDALGTVGSGPSFASGQTQAGVYSYSVTQTVNGCESLPTPVQLTINQLPAVVFTMEDSLCANAAAFDLTGGSPAGGIYSGPGVGANGINFDPSLAGAGTHTLMYTYTDENGCTNMIGQIVKINALPDVTLDPLAAVCQNAPAITLTGSPAGGTFSGEGVSGNLFDPALTGSGEFSVNYTYSDTITGCAVTASQSVLVNPLPVVWLSDTSACGNRTVTLDATTPSVVSYLWNPGNLTTASIQIDTTGRGLGVFAYTVTATDQNNCTGTTNVQVTFYDCTGLEEAQPTVSIDLYPNPNDGQFTIRTNSVPAGVYSIRIYNALNQVVYQENGVSIRSDLNKLLNLRKFPNGMYLLRLENLSNGWSRQFVINR